MKHRRSLAVFFLVPLLFACQFFTPNSESNVAPTLSALPSALSTPLPETNAPDSQATEGASPVSDEADTYQIGWITFLDDPFSVDIAVGPKGGIYAITSNEAQQDCYLSKFDEDGDRQWKVLIATVEYRDCGEIVFDQTGDIYVSGSNPISWGSSDVPANSLDGKFFFIAKFDTRGVNLQNYFFDDGYIYDFAIDAEGNLYLSTDISSADGYGFSLSKINPDGTTEWEKTYPVQWLYYPSSVRVNANNDIFVYGMTYYQTSAEGEEDRDCHLNLIASDGTLKWSAAVGSREDKHEWCYNLEVDSAGNAYISGVSGGTWGDPLQPLDYIGQFDYPFLAKYSPDGTLAWNTFPKIDTQTFAIDIDGNLIIPDSSLVYMNSDGSAFKETNYPSPDSSYYLGMDDRQNIYVSGRENAESLDDSITVINPPAIGGDNEDQIFIANITLDDALSTPLPETNAPDSQATEGASPVSDEADTYQIGWITFLDDPFYHDFAVSPDGAIYVTTINQPPVNQNCYLSKFDENGGAQWKVLIATLEYGVCGEIVFDQSGNIYVSGSDPLAWGGSNDISGNVVFVAKFNPDGVNLQNYLITDIPNNLIGDSVSFEIDSKGNIYISSNEYDEYSKTAFSLIKFNPAGDIEWKKTYSSQWRYFPYHIKTDKNGRVFVYGSISYEDALGKNEGDCFLSLITPDGDMEWSVTLGSEESHDGCSDLVVNDIGDAYVSGSSNAAWGDPLEPWGNPYIDPESGGFLQFIAKISQNGDIVWNTFVESTANLTLDADGNIIIPSPDIVQMDADGSIFRQSIFQGTSEEYFLSFSGLKFDSQNNIYAIGESNGPYDSLNVINPPAEDGGSSDLFIAKVALDDGTYRPGGPFVPEITRHIPTPLDIAMSFLAIWSNLFLAVVAAALMLPFALIIDIFSETLKSISNLALKFWAEIRAGILKYISIPTTANQRLFIEVFKILAGILRLFLIILFYGLIFSFLDPEWTPFSSEGWLLVFEMAIAASIVGILDDMIQWAVIRSWGLPGSLNVRFTNVLASIASVGISRLIPIVPGLMFGSPEALVADEDKFTRKQSNTLTQITVFTFAAICLAAWIPTIFLELIIRADPAEWLKDIAAGMEGFLLIIFAVALENVFVQLMGVSEGLGKKIRQQSILGWAILWTPVAFMFLHTLLNPRNDFLEKVQHGDPFVFVAATIFIMAAAMIFAGLIRLLFWAFKRK